MPGKYQLRFDESFSTAILLKGRCALVYVSDSQSGAALSLGLALLCIAPFKEEHSQ